MTAIFIYSKFAYLDIVMLDCNNGAYFVMSNHCIIICCNCTSIVVALIDTCIVLWVGEWGGN